ncbi:hypothetical protein JOF53_000442 [Crossiella equi]|uniref:Fibronectin type-III domain-containing protein n=1 Tax=Crossiella equi TaxID=130796 RepID=A0ABS5A4S5_9PSEU|nr:DUF4434 domain-containing protein [Crossiella equi]MBP2471570.1 hypothetical protein [Crossiella equi]
MVTLCAATTALSPVALGAPRELNPPQAQVANGALLARFVLGGPAQPKGTPKPGRSRAVPGADALAEAKARDSRSYQDSSKVGTDGELEAASTAWPDAPSGPWVDDCLNSADAHSKYGRTYNRFQWCSRFRLGGEYYQASSGGLQYKGTSTIEYDAIALGSDTTRGIRLYFRARPGTADYSGWANPAERAQAPGLNLHLSAHCEQTQDYCYPLGSEQVQTFDDWDEDASWHTWEVRSTDRDATGGDKVTEHRWFFGIGGSGGGYVGGSVASPPKPIRCDAASYFKVRSQRYNLACVFSDVLPFLQYRIADSAVRGVAQHIDEAFATPNATYPTSTTTKNIPGQYQGTNPPLHRLGKKSEAAKQNASTKESACRKRGEYALTGHPTFSRSTLDCDEYPFHITAEGAANPNWDFSVKAVDAGQNRSAGSKLRWFLQNNRILLGNDPFWVDIPDGASATSRGRTSAETRTAPAGQLAVAAEPPPPVPPFSGSLSGSFIQPDLVDGWTDGKLAEEMTMMKDLRMTQVVLQWAANNHDKREQGTKTAVFPTSQPGYRQVTSTDVVGRTLAKAQDAGLEVWMGLPVSDKWWEVYAHDRSWLLNEAATAKAFARELWSKYGHHSSFKGWYLSFELDNVNFSDNASQVNMIDFYREVLDELRLVTGDKPIVIAPFYNDVNRGLPGWQNPEAWRDMWTRLLLEADVDVIALQDGVGAGHADPATMAEWFAAMSDAMEYADSQAVLVSDTETFFVGASGLQPMTTRAMVTSMKALWARVDGLWSFSFNHYQSPRSKFASPPYLRGYQQWLANVLGNGGDGETPTTPTGLSASVVSPQTVHLSWNRSTDATSGIAGYHIYRDGELVADWLHDGSGFIDRQLDGGRTYQWVVKAFDGSGNESADSNTVSATTPPFPPAPVNHARCGATEPGQRGCPYTLTPGSAAAAPEYPDDGGTELTDGKLGPELYGPEWQGRNAVGEYGVVIDLGERKQIREINSRWFQVRQDYAFLPPKVEYFVSDQPDSGFVLAESIDIPPVSRHIQAKTYRSIDRQNLWGRYVKVVVDGGTAWTLADEVEVRGL